MTEFLPEERDQPLDYSRRMLVFHGNRAADYAGMLANFADMRDDEMMDAVRRRLVAEINAINTIAKALAAGKSALKA